MTVAGLLTKQIQGLREALREIAFAPVCDDVQALKKLALDILLADEREHGTTNTQVIFFGSAEGDAMTTIGKLRALLEKAPKPPWASTKRASGGWHVFGDDLNVEVCELAHETDPRANANLIAAAVNALPDLLRIADAVAGSDVVFNMGSESHWAGRYVCAVCGGRGRNRDGAHEWDCAWLLSRKLKGV